MDVLYVRIIGGGMAGSGLAPGYVKTGSAENQHCHYDPDPFFV
jgi:hypothetical protein